MLVWIFYDTVSALYRSIELFSSVSVNSGYPVEVTLKMMSFSSVWKTMMSLLTSRKHFSISISKTNAGAPRVHYRWIGEVEGWKLIYFRLLENPVMSHIKSFCETCSLQIIVPARSSDQPADVSCVFKELYSKKTSWFTS